MRREGGPGGVVSPEANTPEGAWGESLPPGEHRGVWGESAGTVKVLGGCPHYLAMPPRGPAGDSRSAKRLTAYHIGRFQVCRRSRAFAPGVPGNTASVPQVGWGECPVGGEGSTEAVDRLGE